MGTPLNWGCAYTAVLEPIPDPAEVSLTMIWGHCLALRPSSSDRMKVMQPGNRRMRTSMGVLCAIVTLSALAGTVAGLALPAVPVWAFVGAEVVVVVAGLVGVLYGWRALGAEAPGLTLGLVGGTVLVASAIGYVGAGTASGLPLRPLLALRVVLAGLILVGAVAVTLKRDRRAWTDLLLGAMLGLPGLGLLGMFAIPKGRAVVDMVSGLGAVGGFLVVTGVFLVLTALSAASVHLVIRAFGRPVGEPQHRARLS